MTETQQAARVVLGEWLLPGDDETRVLVEQAVHQPQEDDQRPRRLHTLALVARKALAEEVEIKLRLLLGDSLADLILDGWEDYEKVAQARRTSQEQPGVDQVLTLQKHGVDTDYEHSLDVQVDGITVLTLTATAKVGLELADTAVVFRDGELAEVRSGKVSAYGKVTLEGVVIAERRQEIPLTIALKRH